MPIYQFSCPDHGEFDQFLPVAKRNLAKCPVCNQVAKRVFTTSGIVYKVDGFYQVDSGKRFQSQLGPIGKKKYNEYRHQQGLNDL